MTLKQVAVCGPAHFNLGVSKWFMREQLELSVCTLDLEGDSLTTEELEKGAPLLAKADLIIDTVSGCTRFKKQVVEWIGRAKQPHAPVLTSILHHTATEIASWLQGTAEKEFIGFHPVHFDELKKLELAPAIQTSPELLHQVAESFRTWGKKPAFIQDQVGGIFPRILALIINEASFALSELVASAEDIDQAMKKGTNYPLGPLEWADRIGLDHINWILEGLFREMGDDRYRASPLLKKKMYAKQLGLTTGQGFFSYDE